MVELPSPIIQFPTGVRQYTYPEEVQYLQQRVNNWTKTAAEDLDNCQINHNKFGQQWHDRYTVPEPIERTNIARFSAFCNRVWFRIRHCTCVNKDTLYIDN